MSRCRTFYDLCVDEIATSGEGMCTTALWEKIYAVTHINISDEEKETIFHMLLSNLDIDVKIEEDSNWGTINMNDITFVPGEDLLLSSLGLNLADKSKLSPEQIQILAIVAKA